MLFKTDGTQTYLNQDYVLSYPKGNSGYETYLPDIIKTINEDRKGAKRDEMAKDKDLRIDFVKSNSTSLVTANADYNPYYLLYKTKMVDYAAVTSLTNSVEILYTSIYSDPDHVIPVDPNGWEWNKVGNIGKQVLNPDVKESEQVKSVVQGIGNFKIDGMDRRKQYLKWTVTFNYDVKSDKDVKVYIAHIDDFMKFPDTSDADRQTYGNDILDLYKEDKLVLLAYAIEKNGMLKPSTQNNVELSHAAGEFEYVETLEGIGLTFERKLDPNFVYSFSYTTIINNENALNGNNKVYPNIYKIYANFDNKVSYSYSNGDGFSTPKDAIAPYKSYSVNRLRKDGVYVTPNANSKSNQEVKWTIRVNESNEPMYNLELKDVLSGKHTFKLFEDSFDSDDKPSLDHLSVRVSKLGTSTEFTNYTLLDINGNETSLDNWIDGSSGFTMRFNEPIFEELVIEFYTYGQIVEKADNPLINIAEIKYDANDGIDRVAKVEASVTLGITDTGTPSYKDDVSDVSVSLRYDKNDLHNTNVFEGVKLPGEDVMVLLYRYQEGNIANNRIYRFGKLDSNGEITFKDVESGRYIVKQLDAPDGYYIPDGLTYVKKDRNTALDKAIEILPMYQNALSYIDVENPTNDVDNLVNAAIYNQTPTIKVNKQGVLYNLSGNQVKTPLDKVIFDIKGTDNGIDEKVITNANGNVLLGESKTSDIKLGFGKYTISEPEQDMKGYLRNIVTEEITLERNPSGSLIAKDTVQFENYKINVNVSNITNEVVADKVLGSKFELQVFENGTWERVENIDSPQVDSEGYLVTPLGDLTLFNLNVGKYRLVQREVGKVSNKEILINLVPLEFVAYT